MDLNSPTSYGQSFATNMFFTIWYIVHSKIDLINVEGVLTSTFRKRRVGVVILNTSLFKNTVHRKYSNTVKLIFAAIINIAM